MAPFDPKSTSKLRSALHFRYSRVIEARLLIPSLFLVLLSILKTALSVYLQNTYMFGSIDCNWEYKHSLTDWLIFSYLPCVYCIEFCFLYCSISVVELTTLSKLSDSTVSQSEAAFIADNSSQLTGDDSADICHSHLSVPNDLSTVSTNEKQDDNMINSMTQQIQQ